MLAAFLTISIIALEIVAISFAWRAITSARTSQGAVGWVIFLLAAPYLGVPLYLFLGHHKFRNYLIARRDSEDVIERIAAFKARNAPIHVPDYPINALEKIAELPLTGGNDARLLIDGQETFDAIFAAIDAAESYVIVQFYIIKNDDLGRALRDRLIAAAQRGVSVRVMYDAVGSAKLPKSYRETMIDAGIQVADPEVSRGPQNRFQLNLRNHRKTVIVDGKVGFIGGHNVGDEYMGRDPNFGKWRDTHAAIYGPTVQQLQLVFVEDWHWATQQVTIEDLRWEPEHAAADMPGLIVATGPGDEMETGALLFFTAICAARKRVWIASPYFVPDTDVLTALKQAALRGVDVRLLVPDVIDHKIPWLAAFAYFDEVRQAGVKVMRYTDGFMHQKVVLVDDGLSVIGTTNLDNRSFRLNFEAMVTIFDQGFASQTRAMLEADFARSFLLERTLKEQPRHIRVGAPIARLFSPVL